MIALDPRTTALVLSDLQNGVLSRKLEPLSAEELVEAGKALASRFRAEGALVVLVNGRYARRGRAFRAAQDAPRRLRRSRARPRRARRSQVTKMTWGAFFRTELDSELKRRGVRTIVLGGVATQFGVESTARQAWKLGYELVIVRDATTDLAIEGHDNTMRRIFPRIARVTDSDALAFVRA
jgi:nicotinamidase-related amidase